MKEGAWISAPTGLSAWVDDHAMWIMRAGNAGTLGVSEEVQQRLAAMPSPHTPAGRREVLLAAMDAGLIRVRGHGVTTTFEFTMPFPDMLQAVRPFMQEHFGPFMGCRFNNLRTGEVWGSLFQDLETLAARFQPERNNDEGHEDQSEPRTPVSPGGPVLAGADALGRVTLTRREDVISRLLENHPGLTPEKAQQMLEAYGF